MNNLSPFGKAIQLTKSICDPLFATSDKNNSNNVYSFNTSFQTIDEPFESDEDIPGLSQAEIDNTAEDRKHLMHPRFIIGRRSQSPLKRTGQFMSQGRVYTNLYQTHTLFNFKIAFWNAFLRMPTRKRQLHL